MIDNHVAILEMLGEGAPFDDIAIALNIPRPLIADRIRNAKLAQFKELISAGSLPPGRTPPPSTPRKRFVVDRIQADSIAICSDLEMPDHSIEYLERLVQMSRLMGVRRLLLAGDGIAFDQVALTRWAKRAITQPELGVEDTLDLADSMVEWLLETYDQVDWMAGNHDDRVALAVNGEINLGRLLSRKAGDKFQYVNKRKLIIDTPRGPVWVVHPDGGGQAAKVAQDWYNNNSPKGHIIMPHFHTQVDTTTSDNAFEIHAIGAGRDPGLTEYLAQKAWRGRTWNSSFIIIKDGYFYPFNLKNTNFDLWEKMLSKQES